MFELSKNIDPNKVFLISRSELTERFDPTSYKLVFNFKSNKFPIYKLSEIAFINPSTSFSNLKDDFEISFVPMEAVNDKNGVIKKYQTKKISESKGFTRFKENDLIWAKITPCMQNGKSAVIRNTINGYACGSTEFYVIRPKNRNLLVDYVHFLLRDERVLNNAQNYFGGSAGQQRVSKYFLRNFKIPLPPIEMQQQIVEKIKKSNKIRQQKETKAKELLNSIDGYLLNELGIILPTKNNSLQDRIFTTSFSEVTGVRLDPEYISKQKYLFSRNAKYQFVEFKNILSRSPQYGANEEAVEGNSVDNIRYIRITDVDEWGNLRNDIWKTAKKIDPIYLLENNDILIARTGATVGKSYIFKKSNFDAIFAGYMIRFIVDQKKANPDYIFYYLNSSYYKYWISAIQRPSAQPNINSEEYKSLPINLPPLQKQIEIANHIQGLRNTAKQLQQEAKIIQDHTKQEVERMILG